MGCDRGCLEVREREASASKSNGSAAKWADEDACARD
jgi:hypothetical protein